MAETSEACRIKVQHIMQGGFAVPTWFCETHRMQVGPGDKQCSLGRIDQATDAACARIDLEVGRAAANKADEIKKALKL